MRITLRLSSLFALVGLLFACSFSEHMESERVEWVHHSEWSAQTQFVEWPDVALRGLGVGFVRPEDRDIPPYQRPATDEFHIQAGEPFTTLLLLGTEDDEPYPVLISVFLDYEQVDFTMDGRQGVLHYLEIVPGVDMEIPLEVPIETSGWHDLSVIAFREPNSHPTDPQERLPPALAVGGRRTVVCTGDCAAPAQTLPAAFVGREADVQYTHVNAYPLLPDDGRPPKRRLLLSATVEPGEVFDLELWARNPNDRPEDYVVLPLLDFRQIPFAGSTVLHLRMPSGSELFIPGQIKLPKEEGVHELQFVIIFDAYQALDEVRDPFVNSVLRSALVVTAGK